VDDPFQEGGIIEKREGWGLATYQRSDLHSDPQVDPEEGDEESGAVEAIQGAEPVAVPARRGQEKKTQADRNREKRRRDAEDEQAAKQRLKKQRRELDSVKQYHTEIAWEEALQAANATRKAITKREKALIEPAKLGKHKFQPANVQVTASLAGYRLCTV